MFGLGRSKKEARVAADLAERAIETIADAEAIGRFESIRRFDPGSGDLDVTCEGDDETAVDIGPSPGTAGLVGGILVAVLAPLLLGSLGFVVVVVTGVLWSSRPPRPKQS